MARPSVHLNPQQAYRMTIVATCQTSVYGFRAQGQWYCYCIKHPSQQQHWHSPVDIWCPASVHMLVHHPPCQSDAGHVSCSCNHCSLGVAQPELNLSAIMDKPFGHQPPLYCHRHCSLALLKSNDSQAGTAIS